MPLNPRRWLNFGDEAPQDLKRADFLGAAVAPPLIAALIAVSSLCLTPDTIAFTVCGACHLVECFSSVSAD
ncbi:uncharacterized protein J3R85_000264 [Psidium guajava]|nr:uncharacterized protein J3R85_000264 [Psidium guajava]